MARINEEKIFKIKELIKQNKKVADISKELQVSLNAIYKIKKELEVKPEIKQDNIQKQTLKKVKKKQIVIAVKKVVKKVKTVKKQVKKVAKKVR